MGDMSLPTKHHFCIQLDKLRSDYENDTLVRKNHTLLLSPGEIPKCRHMLFEPLTEDLIGEYLQSNYKYRLPEEYVNFLKHYNGANLCYIKTNCGKFSFATCLFVIFGLPRTQPFGRPLNEEQPYDIRIEDLSRHDELPPTWLKCARFIHGENVRQPYDVFVDTRDGVVYGCKKNDNNIEFSWGSLDQCFCEILSSVIKTPQVVDVL